MTPIEIAHQTPRRKLSAWLSTINGFFATKPSEEVPAARKLCQTGFFRAFHIASQAVPSRCSGKPIPWQVLILLQKVCLYDFISLVFALGPSTSRSADGGM